jgi:hypothetical protein
VAVIVFNIGAQDYTCCVNVLSISVQDAAEARGDSLSFDVVLDSTQLDGNPGQPRAGQIVSMSVDGVKQFEGVILQIDQQVHASRDNYTFSCKAGDYSYLLTAKLVSQEVPAGLAGDIVKQLINTYAPGFGTRYVRSGFSVPKDEFDHVDLPSVLNKYAQGVGFTWYVDFDREVHFTEGETLSGPLGTIDLDQENRIGDVRIGDDVSQLKNRVYVKDATSRASETRRDTFVADGQQSFFRLFSPPFDLDDFKVILNDEELAVHLDPLTTQVGELEGGDDGSCFVCLLNQGLRFSLNNIPEEGAQIEAEYYPEEAGGDGGGLVLVLEDPDSIRMMRQRESAAGYLSSGVHEAVLSVPEMRVATLDPLSFLGGIVLDRSAWPEISGSFKVHNPDVQGWQAGQVVTLKSAKRNLFHPRAFWRQGIKQDVQVHIQTVSKRFHPYPPGAVGYLYEEAVNFSTIPVQARI